MYNDYNIFTIVLMGRSSGQKSLKYLRLYPGIRARGRYLRNPNSGLSAGVSVYRTLDG